MSVDQARRYLESALNAVHNKQLTVAQRDLTYAAEEWSDQCDLHRALSFVRTQKEGGDSTSAEIAAICGALNTYDNLVALCQLKLEHDFSTTWRFPLVPFQLPMITRGQVRAAHAASLVEASRYDDARSQIDAARREKVVLEDNQRHNTKVIAAVECLLFYRTGRWEDLVKAAGELTTTSASDDDNDRCLAAMGNAFGGTALSHLGSFDAGQTKLRYAISANYLAVSAWASLQLGLSFRTAGDEESAQQALSSGMQFATLPELSDAMRNKNTRMRVTAAEVIAARTSFWDPSTEPDIGDFQRQASQDERREVLTAALEELEAMDGMDGIKEQMRTLSSEIMFENELRRRGREVKPKTRHLIFKGPPGTGKTTIANLIVRLYYGLGVIRSHTLVQANRATLVGTVEGQSAEKTLSKLTEARGGVIFIDEAYELLQDRGGQADPYGSEVLTTLLEYMDNHRDDLIVIIAGYEAPIERFLGENPGLKSRFAYSLSFMTYSPDEMWRIIKGMAAKEGRSVDLSVEDRFKRTIEIMWDTDQRGQRVLDVAGNGRFARNVFEQAQGLASRRLMSGGDLSALSDEQLTELTAADILSAMANILKGFGIVNVA